MCMLTWPSEPLPAVSPLDFAGLWNFQHDQRFRILHRERPQQDGVHETVDGGVRADAECKRYDREQGKQPVGSHGPKGVAQVLSQLLEPGPDPNLTAGFDHSSSVPEFAARALPGFRLGHSRFDQVESLLFDMGPDLRVQIPPIHDSTAFMARATPSSICSKLDTSRSNCLRPAAVIL